jgi:phosphoglycolate phosphatase-like HAD superfamily hydrolase
MSEQPDEIDEVPFEWICDDLLAGTLIPFLGAGASVFPADQTTKPPSAAALSRQLAEESRFPPFRRTRSDLATINEVDEVRRHVQAELACKNLPLVSSWVSHVRGDWQRVQDKLRSKLTDPVIVPNALHELIARRAATSHLAIVTTNYDDLMERALDAAGVVHDLCVVAIDRDEAKPKASDPATSGTLMFRAAGEAALRPRRADEELFQIDAADGRVRLTRSVVVKIHGHIDRAKPENDTFVITEEHYVAFLSRMLSGAGLIPGDLVTLMRRNALLFLGYGLRDWNFRVLLEAIGKLQGKDKKRRSYGISLDIEAGEKELWQNRNVTVFNADLGAFVERLNAEILRRKPPAAKAGGAP